MLSTGKSCYPLCLLTYYPGTQKHDYEVINTVIYLLLPLLPWCLCDYTFVVPLVAVLVCYSLRT